jgi:ribulose-5-phosphate 4-epimerase/fuculose-1-phosphate aldolase
MDIDDLKESYNPFPAPSPLEKVLLEELVRAAHLCYERGWSWGTAGNFSLRGSNGLIWQSPSGFHKGALDSKSFVAIDLISGLPRSPTGQKASLEMPVHRGIYLRCKGAKCVVHAHPPSLVKATLNRDSLVFSGHEMQKNLGCSDHTQVLSIDVSPNQTPEAMVDFADRMDPYLSRQASMIILKGHGAYVWGETPLQALGYMEAIEYLCLSQNL